MHVCFADRSVTGPLFLDNKEPWILEYMIQVDHWPAAGHQHGCGVVEWSTLLGQACKNANNMALEGLHKGEPVLIHKCRVTTPKPYNHYWYFWWYYEEANQMNQGEMEWRQWHLCHESPKFRCGEQPMASWKVDCSFCDQKHLAIMRRVSRRGWKFLGAWYEVFTLPHTFRSDSIRLLFGWNTSNFSNQSLIESEVSPINCSYYYF